MKWQPDPRRSLAYRLANPNQKLRQSERDRLKSLGLLREGLRQDDIGLAAAQRYARQYWDHVADECKRLGVSYDWENPPFIRLWNFEEEIEVAEFCERRDRRLEKING